MGSIITGWLFLVSGALIVTVVGVAALVGVAAGAAGALLVAGHVLSNRDTSLEQAERAAREAQYRAAEETRRAEREAKKVARRDPERDHRRVGPQRREAAQTPPSPSAKPRRLESLNGYAVPPEPEPLEMPKGLLELVGDIDEWRSGVPLSQTTGALRAAERRRSARLGVYRDEDAHRSPKWAEERHRSGQRRRGKGKGGGQFLPKPTAAIPPDAQPMPPDRP